MSSERGQATCVPAGHILRQMLNKYEPRTVEMTVKDVAPKVAGRYIDKTQWVPYMWAVLRNADEESNA